MPPGSAVDAEGRETDDPNKVVALMPFGAHKGYGLGLIDELYAAYIGGSLPEMRSLIRQAVRMVGYQPSGPDRAWERADEIVLASRS